MSCSAEMNKVDVRTHSSNPLKKGLTEEQRALAKPAVVDACDDVFEVYLNIEDSKIVTARFDGHGCAISTASIDILLCLIEGKEVEEAKEILDLYNKFINDEIETSGIEEIDQLSTVRLHKSRIKCALISVNTLIELIE